MVQTCGTRKAGYPPAGEVFGLVDCGTGALFFRRQTERFTAASYCSFLEEVLARTGRPIILLQDGAPPHTAAATRAFIARQGGRLTVHQLPSYSPDYNPVEHLWKNMERRATHNRSFPSFEALQDAVASALTYFQRHPEAVEQAVGATLHHLGDLPLAA